MPAVSFSETRKNLTQIADHVANEGVEYTVFKRSKPLFKIVPATQPAPRTRRLVARQAVETRGRDEGETLRVPSREREARAVSTFGKSDGIPDGGEALFEYALRLRERMPRNTPLSSMTPEDLKRELENRDV